MPECMYPYYASTTSYRKGCRCLLCVDATRKSKRKYIKTQKGKESQNRYYSSEKGKMTLQKYEKSEKGKAKNQRYKQSIKGKLTKRSMAAKRRERLQTTLTPEETENIRSIYEECQRISHQTGIPHHVDHIIPLAKGGHHHPSNLQILSATENLKKGTKIVR